jgi:hypothetical protein
VKSKYKGVRKMEEIQKYTIDEICNMLKKVESQNEAIMLLEEQKVSLELQVEEKYSTKEYVLINRTVLDDMMSTLDSCESYMDECDNEISNIESYAQDAGYCVTDAKSQIDDARNDLQSLIDTEE